MNDNIWIRHGTWCKEAKMNLLCFPYAGGSPGIFAAWAKEFKENINLCPVLYPGRDIRMDEPISKDIKNVAREFVKESKELFDIPFGVLGYCAGGLLAYESILCIKEMYNKTPEFFIPISFASPYYKMTLSEICKSTENSELVKYLTENGIVDKDIAKDEDFLDYYLPIIKGDLQAVDNYPYGNVCDLGCDIYAFFGRDDDMFSKDAKELWNKYTNTKCVVSDIDGRHYCMEENSDFIISFIKNIKEVKQNGK